MASSAATSKHSAGSSRGVLLQYPCIQVREVPQQGMWPGEAWDAVHAADRPASLPDDGLGKISSGTPPLSRHLLVVTAKSSECAESRRQSRKPCMLGCSKSAAHQGAMQSAEHDKNLLQVVAFLFSCCKQVREVVVTCPHSKEA